MSIDYKNTQELDIWTCHVGEIPNSKETVWVDTPCTSYCCTILETRNVDGSNETLRHIVRWLISTEFNEISGYSYVPNPVVRKDLGLSEFPTLLEY